MNPTVAQALLAAAGIYLAGGLAFAIWFVSTRIARLDPGAAGAGAGFRILLLPGVAALWPLLARRLRDTAGELPRQHDAHSDATPPVRSDA